MIPAAARSGSAPVSPRDQFRDLFFSGRLLHLLLLFFAVAYILRLFNLKFVLGDEGVAALDAWRISSGQIPHRDFFEIVPPGSFLPLALAFKLFGVSVPVERSLVAVLALLLILSVDRLVSSYARDYWGRSLAVSVLIPFGVNYWPLPSHHWAVDLCQVAALVCLRHGLSSPHPASWGAAAGALCAAGCFCMQDQGAYLLAALALLFFPFVAAGSLRRRLFASWAAGGAAVAAAFALYLLPHVPLVQLARQWVSFPVSQYGRIPGNTGSFFAGWRAVLGFGSLGQVFADPFDNLSMIFSWTFVFLLPWLSLAVLLGLYLRKSLPRAELGLLAAGFAAFLGAALHRWSFTNLIWAAPVPLALAALGVSRSLASPSVSRRTLARLLLGGVVTSVLFYCASLMRDAGVARSFPVRARAGTLRSLVREESQILQEVVQAVEARVPEGTPLFTDGFVPLVNFLTLCPPPTRYNFVSYPVYHTESQAEEILGTLEGKQVRFALLMRPLRRENRLENYFLERFTPVWSNPVAVLLERRPGQPAQRPVPAPPAPSSPAPTGAPTAR